MTDEAVFDALEDAEAAARIPKTLTKLAVPIDGLVHYEHNPRRGNLNIIMHSLTHNGQYKPVVVRKGTNEILAGNHTVMAAHELGWDQIAATFVEVDDDQAARIVLVDNRSNDLASYDDEELAGLLQHVKTNNDELLGTGFQSEDLDDLLAHLNPDDLDDLEDEFGEPDDDDLWPTLSLKLPQELKDRFEDALGSYGHDSKADNLDALLDAHPHHAGG